ncbi:MAG: GAF domain-containing protein [Pseudomonadota bacterium]
MTSVKEYKVEENKPAPDFFQKIVEDNADAILVLDAKGIVLFANKSAESLLAQPREALMGNFFGFPIVSDDATEITIFQPPDTFKIGLIHCSDTVWQEQPVSVLSIRDITSQKEVENALRLDDERLNSLLIMRETTFLSEEDVVRFALESAVSLTDSLVGYLHFFNADENTINLTAWSDKVREICAIQPYPHYPLDKAGIWADCIRLKEPVIHNNYPISPDKKGYPEGHFPVSRHMSVPVWDTNRNIVGVIGVGNKVKPYNNDDTRQLSLFANNMWSIISEKRLEQDKNNLTGQLRQAQKLEAIGTLAGGIAHDFNNILVPIISYSELIEQILPKENECAAFAEKIKSAGERARELVRQILSFSRQSKAEKIPLLPAPIIKECVKFIQTTLPKNLTISLTISDDMSVIKADPTELHQIVMNLCTNAIHAARESGSRIEVALCRSEGIPLLLLQEKGEGAQYLTLSCSDDGYGMSAATMERIFDPFFTTKSKDEGTGLGLSVVHGIVLSYGGDIAVESAPGKGTTFRIFLPIADDAEKNDQEKKEQSAPTGSEKILLVDDEDMINKVLQRTLAKLGYTVTSRTSGAEALQLMANKPGEFDLIITDYSMPGMNGLEFTRKLRSFLPATPVIICTGFTQQIKKSILEELKIAAIVNKPVLRHELAQAVRRAIDKNSGQQ